ncbi:uncharacterized protein LOC127049438 [Gopherus flavomarginatus]|uniref:uncharacterized protein LOC127049438 n=1 Tax=Gopherus flavomarginatus TaxID=286002 RepID=UPI0021CBFF07|nr:uncharacterized protein LOC127049438 [Gopherus flavomarginatus]
MLHIGLHGNREGVSWNIYGQHLKRPVVSLRNFFIFDHCPIPVDFQKWFHSSSQSRIVPPQGFNQRTLTNCSLTCSTEVQKSCYNLGSSYIQFFSEVDEVLYCEPISLSTLCLHSIHLGLVTQKLSASLCLPSGCACLQSFHCHNLPQRTCECIPLICELQGRPDFLCTAAKDNGDCQIFKSVTLECKVEKNKFVRQFSLL